MELESARLRMIGITWNDLEDIHNLHSIPEVDEFNTLGIPKNMDETREIIRPVIESGNDPLRKSYAWKIVLKEINSFIGMTREGLRRKILPVRGRWIDNYHYAIVEDDPRDY